MLRPRIKHVHSPRALPDGRIVVGTTELHDDESRTVETLLRLLDGTRYFEDVCRDLRRTHPGIDPNRVRDVIADLTRAGFVEEGAPGLPGDLTERETTRYESSRHFYAWVDRRPRTSPYEVQAKLKDSSVAVVGLGATGSAVAAGLVAGGVGAVHCVDFDKVDEAGLSRQLLYTEADLGEPKLDRALDRLRAMNSLVEITGTDRQVRGADDLAELMTDRDALVLCADRPHPDISRWTNEAALRTGTPWFVSLCTGPVAAVGAYHPGRTGCWECLHRKENDDEDGRAILPGGPANAVVAAGAAVAGQLCALEVVYHLGGLPTQVTGRLLHWDLADWGERRFTDVPHDPGCPACGDVVARQHWRCT